jgi:hypothetical protein
MIASVRPVAYEQNMASTKNWTGNEPTNLSTDYIGKGVFSVPADPANEGGKFVFNHRASIVITEIFFNMSAGASWTLYRCRTDSGGGTVKDLIKSGSSGITHTKNELPVLHVGEWLELKSTGTLTATSRAKIYVRYTDENVS